MLKLHAGKPCSLGAEKVKDFSGVVVLQHRTLHHAGFVDSFLCCFIIFVRLRYASSLIQIIPHCFVFRLISELFSCFIPFVRFQTFCRVLLVHRFFLLISLVHYARLGSEF